MDSVKGYNPTHSWIMKGDNRTRLHGREDFASGDYPPAMNRYSSAGKFGPRNPAKYDLINSRWSPTKYSGPDSAFFRIIPSGKQGVRETRYIGAINGARFHQKWGLRMLHHCGIKQRDLKNLSHRTSSDVRKEKTMRSSTEPSGSSKAYPGSAR